MDIECPSGGHQAELAKVLRQAALRHSLGTVFRDFVAMAALALSNAADPWQRDSREAEYLAILVDKMSQVLAEYFPTALASKVR